MNLSIYKNLRLPQECILLSVTESEYPLTTSSGNPASAKTMITEKKLEVILQAGMSEAEQSISLYHEVLEGMTLAVTNPPDSVIDYLESDFEFAAKLAHKQFGLPNPQKLSIFLKEFGF